MSWLAASLSLTDGRVLRFGGDEQDAENVPSGIQFDTNIPGGFGAASVTLPRPENLRADDAKLFSHVVIYGPGLRVAYEGYVTGVPQVGAQEIELQLSGWSTVLDRIETFREIFVDRDLSRWADPSISRQVVIRSTYQPIGGPTVTPDLANGLPSIQLVIAAHASGVAGRVESWYDAGPGVNAASVYYDMTSTSAAVDQGKWVAADDDAATGAAAGSDLLTGVNSTSAGTHTPATAKRYIYFTFYDTTAATTTEKLVTLRRLAVFGDHGLTKRGTAPDEGFYGSDIINYAVGQAPDLTASLGDSIEETAFVIPHLTFTEDTSLASAIEQVTALGGNQNVPNDWGVYDNREFFWRSPGTYGRTWYVRRDQVATSSSDGPDADRRVAGVKVNYTDGSGTSLSVGPPDSNADYETSDLLDSDTDNPAHRISGAFKSESVGITSQQGAINIGVLILNERNRLDWRGSVEVQGEAQDINGNTFPSYLIRAGDQIVIEDAEDTTPRTIKSTSYDHGSMTTTAAIGARPDSFESLLGQLALATGLAVG